ncbi:S-adenosylmethionine:tRNA ribosyltransferase-isomerase [Candidatus Ruthturnera calyptogenae]
MPGALIPVKTDNIKVLVNVFIERTQMMDIYQHAINQKYLFFSYRCMMLL